MNYLSAQDKLGTYGKVGVHANVEVASPYRLIQMLMEGALDKIAIAKGHMQRNDVAATGSHISWAISIIDGLRMSLDKDVPSDVTTNLDALYDYMGRRLLEANMKKEADILDEVSTLLHEVKDGWDNIPAEFHDAHQRRDEFLK